MTSLKERICLVVCGKTLAAFMASLEQAQASCHVVELRIDSIPDINTQYLAQIAQKLAVNAIVTCRSRQHGGDFTGSVVAQSRLLQAANDLGFSYVDVDLAIAEQVCITNKQCKVIISHHDFKKTPATADLIEVREKMRRLNADICKIATWCQSEKDARRLLAFLLAKQADEEMIVLGMGDYGKMTRLLAPLCGACLTFASRGSQFAELGHIPHQQLIDCYDEIEKIMH